MAGTIAANPRRRTNVPAGHGEGRSLPGSGPPRAGGTRAVYLRIVPAKVTGRRIETR
jgi:hypothetical protein